MPKVCPFCNSKRIRIKIKKHFSLTDFSTISAFARCKKCGATATSSELPFDPCSMRLLSMKRMRLMWKQKTDSEVSSDA